MFSLATSLTSSPQLIFNQTLTDYKNASRATVPPDPGASDLFPNTAIMLETSSSLLEASTMEIFEDSTLAPTNNSFTEYAEIPYYIKATSMTFCVVIMCLGVIGNVMVPIVILKTKDMRNSTNIFLVNLSVADLMVLLVCTPTVLVEVNSKPETWVLGKELCLAVPFVELTVAHASVLTILAISFERYYAICEPLRAGYVCTKTRAALICALAWLFAAVFTSPILAIAKFSYEEHEDSKMEAVCLTQADTFWSALFFILTIALFFIIPLGILLVLYSIIAKNLMENPVLISHSSKNSGQSGNVLRYRKQVILMLGTVVLSFFVCLLPFKALTLWIIIFPPETIMALGIDGYYILLYFCRIMLYLNSAINPILYNLMSSKFRDGFRKMLKINKLMKCNCKFKENMQRRDTFNTTTSTGFSSSQHASDSFWRRYSRTTSQKNAAKESKKVKDTDTHHLKVGEIINVENTRRNSMKIIADMNEDAHRVRVDVHYECQGKVETGDNVTENNKSLHILDVGDKTGSVYKLALDVSDDGERRNKFVCVPVQDVECKNILVYDFNTKESFV